MQFEFTAFARTTEGRGASRRMRRAGKAPGIVYGGTTRAAADRARSQRALPRAAQRGVPRVDPHDEARRRRHQGAAARRADASVPERDPARRLPARRREPQDPHEGAAALHQRRDLAGGEGLRRDREPRAQRSRHCLPAEGPAGVHRGRPRGARRRPLGARLRAEAPGRRHRRSSHGKADPVVASAVVPKAHVEEEAAAAPPKARPRPAPSRRRRPLRAGAEAKPGEKAGDKKESAKDDKKK